MATDYAAGKSPNSQMLSLSKSAAISQQQPMRGTCRDSLDRSCQRKECRALAGLLLEIAIPAKNYIRASKAEQRLPLRCSLNTTRLQREGPLSAGSVKMFIS